MFQIYKIKVFDKVIKPINYHYLTLQRLDHYRKQKFKNLLKEILGLLFILI